MSTINIHLDNITNILANIGERVEGNLYCDVEPHQLTMGGKEKRKNLIELCVNKKKILEIGFNAGHSALFMLDSNPLAEYVFFDLGFHKYTQPCFDYLESAFSNTPLSIYYGDSKKTLSDFSSNAENVNSFDLVHLDGGHDTDTLVKDYYNSMLLLKKGGVIIVDDTDYPHINDFVNEQLESDNVQELSLTPTERHRILQKIIDQ
jgi:predicted O-methyltransferase YrrM